ncbi:MAG: nuclear transport factor 2 family protein [Pseudomonadota bacterium]
MNYDAIDPQLAERIAKQDIGELRRRYGHATDLIGVGDAAAKAQGLQIYREIFTGDAHLEAASIEAVSGPDAWYEVVRDALSRYQATQHLIGSQIVTIESLPGGGRDGRAHMESYLSAWHSTADEVMTFIGTYVDECVYSPSHGWQIAKMDLIATATELRALQAG